MPVTVGGGTLPRQAPAKEAAPARAETTKAAAKKKTGTKTRKE